MATSTRHATDARTPNTAAGRGGASPAGGESRASAPPLAARCDAEGGDRGGGVSRHGDAADGGTGRATAVVAGLDVVAGGKPRVRADHAVPPRHRRRRELIVAWASITACAVWWLSVPWWLVPWDQSPYPPQPGNGWLRATPGISGDTNSGAPPVWIGWLP